MGTVAGPAAAGLLSQFPPAQRLSARSNQHFTSHRLPSLSSSYVRRPPLPAGHNTCSQRLKGRALPVPWIHVGGRLLICAVGKPSRCTSRDKTAAQPDEPSGRRQRVDRLAETDRRPPQLAPPAPPRPSAAAWVWPRTPRTRHLPLPPGHQPTTTRPAANSTGHSCRRRTGDPSHARVPVTLRAGGVGPSRGGGIPCSGPRSVTEGGVGGTRRADEV